MSKLIVTPLPDGKYWELLQDFKYKGITVPKGFKTDMASVPWLFRRLFPPATGKYREAAVVHDYLYFKQLIPRKDCDRVFLEHMAELGVIWYKRMPIYWAVRVGGFVGWNNRKKALKELLDADTDDIVH